MNLTRKTKTYNASKFSDFLSNIDEATDVYKSFGRCDFVFDQYSEEPGVKDVEAQRRVDCTPIVVRLRP